MQTLTYGLFRPDVGDKGSTFFKKIRDDITQLDAHNHDGANSSLINSASIAPVTQVISGGVAWVLVYPGLYRQAITMPGSIPYDNRYPLFKLSTGETVFLTTEKIDATHYYVYINDPSISLVAHYV